MNLEKIIKSNKNQFKGSTRFEQINDNEFLINFNNKLKVKFILIEEEKILAFEILEQDERYWNKDKDFQDEDNYFNFNSFNGWKVRTNNSVFFSFNSQLIDLKSYDLEDNDKDWSYYDNQDEIIDLILALEDWSINCPQFKEGV